LYQTGERKELGMFRLINKTFNGFNSKSPILVQTPILRYIGNSAEEMYFGLLKAKRERKKVLFLFLRHPLFWVFTLRNANNEIFRVESEYIVSNGTWYGRLAGWLITIVYSLMRVTYVVWRSPRLRRMIHRIWPKIRVYVAPDSRYSIPWIGRWSLWKPNGVTSFSWATVEDLCWREQLEGYRPPTIPDDKVKHAERLRVQMGIPITDWFVCLHARESGYRNDSAEYRNADITRYIDGIKLITDAGGWVVRIGDSSMTPLPSMDHVIDYPFTQYKSELMDLYLISECRFFVGTNSGPTDVAFLFGKSVVLVNQTEWFLQFPWHKGDLAIIKHIYSHSRGRFLSVQEILDEPFGCQNFCPPPDDLVRYENTTEEIRDVIKEFLDQPKVYEYSKLQEAFNSARTAQVHRWLDNAPFSPAVSKDEVAEVYRYASRTDSVQGSIGQKYLEQNWLVDNLGNAGRGGEEEPARAQ
jgi:putative glycosyltransferase (TIGR04372 family)